MICVYCDCDIPEDQIHKIPGSCLQVLKSEKQNLLKKINDLQASERIWKAKAEKPDGQPQT